MAMNHSVWGVCALSLVFACSAGPAPANPSTPATGQGTPPPKESPVPPKLEVLDAQVLRDCMEMKGSVALVRVRELKGANAGTRGSRVRIEYELEQALHGSLPRQAGFWSWGAATTHQVGERLIVALKPAPADAKDVALLGSVPVPPGQEAEAVRAHTEALSSAAR